MKKLKQGINAQMRVNVGIDLDQVETIVFVCEQGHARKMWTYPSNTAVRVEDSNVISLEWSWADTFEFEANANVMLDSKIFLTSSKYNPPTEKVSFRMDSTLFTEAEIGGLND